jgi:hypothetical protein
MRRLLLLFSLITLVSLDLGTMYLKHNMFFLMADSSKVYEYAIMGLIVLILIQIFTKPPLHFIFRFLTASAAVMIAAITIIVTFNGTMPFLDTASFLMAATSIGLGAVERGKSDTDQQVNQPNNDHSPLIA